MRIHYGSKIAEACTASTKEVIYRSRAHRWHVTGVLRSMLIEASALADTAQPCSMLVKQLPACDIGTHIYRCTTPINSIVRTKNYLQTGVGFSEYRSHCKTTGHQGGLLPRHTDVTATYQTSQY